MAAAYWAAHSGAFNETSVAKEAHGVSRFAARPSTSGSVFKIYPAPPETPYGT